MFDSLKFLVTIAVHNLMYSKTNDYSKAPSIFMAKTFYNSFSAPTFV